MSPKNDRGALPEIRGGGLRVKHMRPTDLWVAPVLGKALVEGFCYEGILFMGLVDLDRVLIITKITN